MVRLKKVLRKLLKNKRLMGAIAAIALIFVTAGLDVILEITPFKVDIQVYVCEFDDNGEKVNCNMVSGEFDESVDIVVEELVEETVDEVLGRNEETPTPGATHMTEFTPEVTIEITP